jgi:hypothetical protein
MDLFELVGRIAIQNGDANQALDDTSAKGQQTESKLSKAFSAAGKGAAVAGKAVMTGLAAGGAAMGALTVKALNLGGELEQNMGGSEAVFKDYAGKMQETAKNAFQNMGLSTSEFLGTANKMGALFQGAGFSIKESSELSASAMQRAADVASIMGIDTSAAMEAIAGAAKGNFTMMDNLGVAMNDTTLNAYAAAKGIKKTTQEMTNQEKIGLAMEMFMEKTAYAAGNYAKENETLAGSLGTAKSALTNFLDGSGSVDQLVGAFSNAANVIVKNVKEIAPRLISGITELMNQIVPMIPPLMNELLPVIIDGAISLMFGLAEALPGIITALTAVLPNLIYDLTAVITEGLISSLPTIIGALVAALPAIIPALVDGLMSIIVSLMVQLPQIIQPIIAYLPEIIILLVDALMANLPALISGCVDLVVGLVAAMPQIILALLHAVPTIMTSIVDGLIGALPVLINGWNTIWQAVTDAISVFMTNISGVVVNIWNGIVNSVKTILGNLKNIISMVWGGIKTAISSVLTSIKTVISGAWNTVTSLTSSVWNTIKSATAKVWNAIPDTIRKPIEKARDAVKSAIDKIKGFFNFKFEWPKLKMPKFAISPSGWQIGDLLKGKIPKLGIEWHADAMRKPMIMDSPTVFGYNPATGSLMGGGEAGSEVVSGTGTLLNLIHQVVRAENNAMAQQLGRITDLLVQFFPDALDAMRTPMMFDTNGAVLAMAPAMDAELGRIAIRKGRGR